MNKHENIKAKGKPEWTSLYDHLTHVSIVAVKFAYYSNLDTDIAETGAILHDIGKAHPVFQKQLYGTKPKQTFRHEIASLFFLILIKDEWKPAIIEMIVAHHKSIKSDVARKGILDLLEEENDVIDYHLGDWATWSSMAIDILNCFGFPLKQISKSMAVSSLNEVINFCMEAYKGNRGFSEWRGLLMGADYFASAQLDKTEEKIKNTFAPPDLSFYKRKHLLYPLSYYPAYSDKKHTLVIASTGAGKTDFLLRRCKGRVFYTLPFQASINAMYRRLKNDLQRSNPDLDIRILHAASSLIGKEDGDSDTSLQEMIGASIKVLTPYQMAGITFGSKGYESIILDLKGSDVILDEVHTYSGISQAIVLKIVSLLKELKCRIHIGTATIPSILCDKINEILGRDNIYEVKLSKEEMDSFDRHIVNKIENSDKISDIIKSAIEKEQKVLIVCNKVKNAQEFYQKICDDYPKVAIMLIHSRFKRRDRNEKEKELIGIDEYGNPTGKFNTSHKACIVVATQVVEVSLDISFDVMITETAPLDALIQRFGRINRMRSNDTIGNLRNVYVISPPDDEKEAKPYELELLKKSFAVLPNGKKIMERDLQEKIDKVFTEINYPSIEQHSVFKATGDWSIPLLTHNSPMLLDLLEIDSVVCVVEEDVDKYIRSSYEERMQYEIPCRYYQVNNMPHLNVGHKPYVVSSYAYSSEKGFSSELVKKQNVESQLL